MGREVAEPGIPIVCSLLAKTFFWKKLVDAFYSQQRAEIRARSNDVDASWP